MENKVVDIRIEVKRKAISNNKVDEITQADLIDTSRNVRNIYKNSPQPLILYKNNTLKTFDKKTDLDKAITWKKLPTQQKRKPHRPRLVLNMMRPSPNREELSPKIVKLMKSNKTSCSQRTNRRVFDLEGMIKHDISKVRQILQNRSLAHTQTNNSSKMCLLQCEKKKKSEQ